MRFDWCHVLSILLVQLFIASLFLFHSQKSLIQRLEASPMNMTNIYLGNPQLVIWHTRVAKNFNIYLLISRAAAGVLVVSSWVNFEGYVEFRARENRETSRAAAKKFSIFHHVVETLEFLAFFSISSNQQKQKHFNGMYVTCWTTDNEIVVWNPNSKSLEKKLQAKSQFANLQSERNILTIQNFTFPPHSHHIRNADEFRSFLSSRAETAAVLIPCKKLYPPSIHNTLHFDWLSTDKFSSWSSSLSLKYPLRTARTRRWQRQRRHWRVRDVKKYILPSFFWFSQSSTSWNEWKNYDSGNYTSWFELMACWMFWKICHIPSRAFPHSAISIVIPTSCQTTTTNERHWAKIWISDSGEMKRWEKKKFCKFMLSAYYITRNKFSNCKRLDFSSSQTLKHRSPLRLNENHLNSSSKMCFLLLFICVLLRSTWACPQSVSSQAWRTSR